MSPSVNVAPVFATVIDIKQRKTGKEIQLISLEAISFRNSFETMAASSSLTVLHLQLSHLCRFVWDFSISEN